MVNARKGSIGRVEAARYALLRRLAPAIRHALVGKLHPIGLMSEALARRLQSAPEGGPADQTRDSLQKIHELSRSAVAACTELISWLAPEEGAIGLAQGVEECLALLGTDISMRGHAMLSNMDGADMQVSRSALRSVLAASLIAQADALTRPADLGFSAGREGGVAVLRLAVQNARREAMPPPEDNYRRLTWKEVRVLAEAEGVQLSRQGRGIELRLAILA